MLKVAIADIETESLTPDTLWCNVVKELGGHGYKVWDINSGYSTFPEYAATVDRWVFHNGISFDVPVINRLVSNCIPFDKVCDTFVVSRLVNYPNYNGHGLDEIGISLGQPKTVFNDFSQYTPEMLSYCKDDVDLGEKVYKKYEKYINDPAWAKSMEIEHKTAQLCKEMYDNGFKFNLELAYKLLPQIKERINELEFNMKAAWPDELVEVNRIKYRTKLNGELHNNVINSMSNYPKTIIDTSDEENPELVCYDWRSFNPGSTKDRVEKLWEAGWEPTEKSNGHYKFSMRAAVGESWGKTVLTQELYDNKKEYFSFYGWTVSDENLATLPVTAPQSARDLAEWLCLNGRLKALEERVRECETDGRIRTTFWHIGAWTHRMSHSSPNLANISSPFHGEVKTAVDVVKDKYDADFRRMFTVDEGHYLVGTDAESIQLRVLAHYLRNEEYIEAIINGKKEDETDIHNVNKRSLSLNHLTRDDAKTFIYAFLLGAGTAKVARILRCSNTVAKGAVESFIENTKGLGKLRNGLIKRDAARGYFEGLDGRKVINNSEYLMLAGYLQNGEAVTMKQWVIRWVSEARKVHLPFKLVNFVHDEVQVEVMSNDRGVCDELIDIQTKAMDWVTTDLGLICPMGIEAKIGSPEDGTNNWLGTH